jgi:hypothetical protein
MTAAERLMALGYFFPNYTKEKKNKKKRCNQVVDQIEVKTRATVRRCGATLPPSQCRDLVLDHQENCKSAAITVQSCLRTRRYER